LLNSKNEVIKLISNINNSTYTSAANTATANTQSKETKNEKSKTTSETSQINNGVIVDINNSTSVDTTTYKKPTGKIDTAEINKLLNDADKATSALRDIVEKLISKQGNISNTINFRSVENSESDSDSIVIDQESRNSLQDLLSEDGEYGVKKTSQRIVDFAKALAGNDKSKISELRSAIQKGFGEVEKTLGDLPDISKQTYDTVMSELDKWENSSE
jgi:hypothetical protein